MDTVVPAGVQMKNYVMNYNVVGGGMTAPIQKGDKIATVEFWYQNSCVTEAELYAVSDVRAVGDTGVSVRGNGDTGDSGGSGALSVIGTVCVVILGPVGVNLACNSFMRPRRRARTRRRRAERRRSR